jgi:tetratricopeptide (TPR) repeat protein
VWADSAIALDPNYLLARNTAAYVGLERKDYGRALAAFEAARRLSNDAEALNALAGSALVLARAGRKAEALATLAEAESEAKAFSPAPIHTVVFMAQVYAALGEADRSVAWLDRYQPRASMHFQLHLRCDPPFDPIVSVPGFRALLTLPHPPPGGGC